MALWNPRYSLKNGCQLYTLPLFSHRFPSWCHCFPHSLFFFFFAVTSPPSRPLVCFLFGVEEKIIFALPLVCWYGKSERPATNVNLVPVVFFSPLFSALRFRLCFILIRTFPFRLSAVRPFIFSPRSEQKQHISDDECKLWMGHKWWEYKGTISQIKRNRQKDFDSSDMIISRVLLHVHMLFTINTSCWRKQQPHWVSIVVIKVENVFACFPFSPQLAFRLGKVCQQTSSQSFPSWQSKVITFLN